MTIPCVSMSVETPGRWRITSGELDPSWDIENLCKEGKLEKALVALKRMDEQGSVASVHIFRHLLQACTRKKALAEAKVVHAHLEKCGLKSNRLLDLVVTTLVNCGGLGDGLEVFQRLSQRTVFSWTAVLAGHVKAGKCREALAGYEQMRQEGVQPDNHTFVALLKACSRLQDLQEGKRIHSEAVEYGLETDVFVGSSLVSMYAKCGSIVDAQQVFDRLSERNVVSWNAILAAYAQQGQGDHALQIYGRMQREGVSPDARTFVSVLQACGAISEDEDLTVVNGQKVKMRLLQQGKVLHAAAAVRGFVSDLFVGSSLVSMYAKCGSLVDAQQVFDGLTQRDAVLWAAMAAAYAQQNRGELALQMYQQMQEAGIRPNQRVFVSALRACGILAEKEIGTSIDGSNVKIQSLRKGKEIHAVATQRGVGTDIFVGNALLSMYGKCGSRIDMQHVFDRLSQREVVSWNTMLASYAQQGEGTKALQMLWQMEMEGVTPDARTCVAILQACGSLAEKENPALVNGQHIKLQSLQKGKEMHARATFWGLGADVFVASTLVSVYAKCGSLTDAQEFFDSLSQRDVVSWTAIIAAYAQHGLGQMALQMYGEMQQEGVPPDGQTFVSALQACGTIAEEEKSTTVEGQIVKVESLKRVKEMHAGASRRGFPLSLFLGSALISTYAKCGSIKDAEYMFARLPQRDVVSWTAMIAGYAQQDQGDKALQLYAQMQVEGTIPHEPTYIAVLEACGNTGALDICLQVHQNIVGSTGMCSLPLANSLIHAYGRCGSMADAQLIFDSLSQPDTVSWTALIAGYAREGDCQMSIRCYDAMCLSGEKPDSVTFLALLTACSHAGSVDEGLDYFETMTRDHGIHPQLEHYACVVDLVGRAGLFSKAEELLSKMSVEPDLPVWLSLLGACQKYGNVALGRRAFNNAVYLEPKHGAAYALMSNIYANVGMRDSVEEIQNLKLAAGASKDPGQSWMQHKQKVHTFLVGDSRHQQESVIYGLLQALTSELEDPMDYAS